MRPDVGDLDRVIQVDAPGSVSSFLQRMGRTGRRPGLTRNCTFLATDDARYITGISLVVDGGVLVQQRSVPVDTFPLSRFPKL